MEYRKWDVQTKFRIVLEGLKGNSSVTELCNRYQISQTQYYKWRDLFLAHGPKVFETTNENKELEKQKRHIEKLKAIIGDLTVELKKNDFED